VNECKPLLGGLAQLEYLKVLTKRIDTDWDGVMAGVYTRPLFCSTSALSVG